MYKKFFGLKHEPFSIAPDPHYLFMSERHREALAHLLFGLKSLFAPQSRALEPILLVDSEVVLVNLFG